jgi:hypothetical protein
MVLNEALGLYHSPNLQCSAKWMAKIIKALPLTRTLLFDPEDRDSTLLRNVGELVLYCMASHDKPVLLTFIVSGLTSQRDTSNRLTVITSFIDDLSTR